MYTTDTCGCVVAYMQLQHIPTHNTPTYTHTQYTQVPPQHKLAAMITHLLTHQHDKGIVYFLTCAEVDFFRTTLPLLPQCKVGGTGCCAGAGCGWYCVGAGWVVLLGDV